MIWFSWKIVRIAAALLSAGLAAHAEQPVVSVVTRFGSSGTAIQAMATDAAGNIYIAGSTAAAIPLVNALKPTLSAGVCSGSPLHYSLPCQDIFLAKFDPTGKQILWSTYLGTDGQDFLAGLAVDRDGVYIAGSAGDTQSTADRLSNPRAFLYKVNAAGTAIVYSRFFGANTEARGVAVDSAGRAFLTGIAAGVSGFQPVNALQSSPPFKMLYATRDGGATWTLMERFPKASISSIAVDPARTSTLYAATSAGLYKSTDSGANWTQLLSEDTAVRQVTLDPLNPSTVYVTYGDLLQNGGYAYQFGKSTDGGAAWKALVNAPPSSDVKLVGFAVAPTTPSTVWMENSGRAPALFRSLDGGLHWEDVQAFTGTGVAPDIALSPGVFHGVLVDPNSSSRVFACCYKRANNETVSSVVRTEDGGATWLQGAAAGPTRPPVIDPRDSTLYSRGPSLMRSVDKGETWQAVETPDALTGQAGALAMDSQGGLHLTTADSYFYRSPANVWTTRAAPWPHVAASLTVDPSNPAVVYASVDLSAANHGFAARLAANGTVDWATLLAGSEADEPKAIAVDAGGNPVIGGTTTSPDFPLAGTYAQKATPPGKPAPFLSRISSDGQQLLYSSYLGDSSGISVTALAVDSDGGTLVAGSVIMAALPNFTSSFLAKVPAGGGSPVYQSVFANGGAPVALTRDSAGHIWALGIGNPVSLISPLQPNRNGNGHLTRFSAKGVREFATHVGNSIFDVAALAPTDTGGVWMAGNTYLDNAGIFARVDPHAMDTTPEGTPLVRAVYNSAAYFLGDEVSPGEIVSIFGLELAPAAEAAAATPLPKTLQGVSVLVGGIAAPLLYVSPGQINFQVPYEIPSNAVSLVVRRGAASSVERPLTVKPTTPAIYVLGPDLQTVPAVVHASDYSLVNYANPASPGEYIVIFCNGLGITDPPIPSGEAAAGAVSSVARVTEAYGRTVTYAGLAPGFAGLYQVNVRLSDSEQRGMVADVFLRLGSGYTNRINVPVK